jgi:hypothetical protein
MTRYYRTVLTTALLAGLSLPAFAQTLPAPAPAATAPAGDTAMPAPEAAAKPAVTTPKVSTHRATRHRHVVAAKAKAKPVAHSNDTVKK